MKQLQKEVKQLNGQLKQQLMEDIKQLKRNRDVERLFKDDAFEIALQAFVDKLSLHIHYYKDSQSDIWMESWLA